MGGSRTWQALCLCALLAVANSSVFEPVVGEDGQRISSVQPEVSPEAAVRFLADGEAVGDAKKKKKNKNKSIPVPGSFKSGRVNKPSKDLKDAKIDDKGFVHHVERGSAVYYSVDVKKAGKYQVTYSLSGSPAKPVDVVLGIKKGHAKCPPAGGSAKASINNFKGAKSKKPINYRGTDITLKKGKQQLTLCVEKGGNLTIQKICIDKKCTKPGTVDARKPLGNGGGGGNGGGKGVDKGPAPWTNKPGDTCTQFPPPPGVKPGGCIEITCLPDAVSIGSVFHTNVKWCLQRPRQWHLSFDLLDMTTKAFITATGFSSSLSDYDYQCGEATLKQTFKATRGANGVIDVMWKYFVTPRHYLDHPTDDIFPNMLAESGIYKQPQYLADGVPTQGDCPILKTRLWNEKPTGKQDAVEYTKRPACITPGKPWSIQIRYHLESIQKADMRTNLMLGTGGDKYLGPNDVFVTDNVFTVSDNKGWTTHTVQFTAAQTQLFAKRPSPYVTSFMVPAGSEFNGGWQMVDSEKNLQIKYC